MLASYLGKVDHAVTVQFWSFCTFDHNNEWFPLSSEKKQKLSIKAS